MTVIPADEFPPIELRTLSSLGPRILEQLVVAAFPADGARRWTILDGRFALDSKRTTLRELADAYELSRERIRQIEEQVLASLAGVIRDPGSSGAPALRPDLTEALDRLHGLVPVNDRCILESELQDQLGRETGTPLAPAVHLMLELGGANRMEFPRRTLRPLWHRLASDAATRRRELIERVAEALTTHLVDYSTPLDVVTSLNTPRRWCSLNDVEAAIAWLPGLEREAGKLRAPLGWLVGRGNQAYRLLIDAGEPMDARDLAARIDAAVPGRSVGRENLINQLTDDKRFIPMGKSGRWGLGTRDAGQSGTFPELASRVLRERGEPMSSAEIAAGVSLVRPIGATYLTAFLYQGEFVRLKDGTWALPDWRAARDPARIRQPRVPRQRLSPVFDAVSDRAKALLRAAPERRMRFQALVDALEIDLKRPRPTIYSYVSKLDFIASEVADDGTRWVRLGDGN
jgi:DNA-directed RNA polymerase delta subunit